MKREDDVESAADGVRTGRSRNGERRFLPSLSSGSSRCETRQEWDEQHNGSTSLLLSSSSIVVYHARRRDRSRAEIASASDDMVLVESAADESASL